MSVVAVTGHRPDKIGGYDRLSRVRLVGFAREHLRRLAPERVITGMALGWDQAVALACTLEQIPFTAAVPCPGQASKWPDDAQHRYRQILAHAAEVVTIGEFYCAAVMQRRNQWMVDRADHLLALWDGSLGGTGNCVNYAIRRRKPWTNLWLDWEMVR